MRGHIRKRGSTYSIVVDIGRDENGKRKQKWISGFKTKKEAEKALAEIIAKIEKNELELTNLTLGQFLNKWYETHCELKLAPKTLKSYKELIELYFKPYLGDIELTKLKPVMIQNYYNKLKELGLSDTTINYHHRVLKSALKKAVVWQLISKNPCDYVEPPKKNKNEITVWSINDVKKAKEIFKDTPIYLHFMLALYTGMRIGEICGLKWEDIDFNNKTCTVKRQYQQVGGKEIIKEPKSETSIRVIPLHSDVIEVLKEEKKKQLQNRMLLGEKYNKKYEGYISVWEDGRMKTPEYVSKKFSKILKAYPELPQIRFHDLRHSCASFLVQAGVPMKVVSEILGHSQIGITMDLYSHVLLDSKKEAIKKLEEYLQ
ncbi:MULTISPECIES: site-specific integrase [Thermoanaerobacter]|uniref:Phage integrase family protein n=2 Tax=Thermoanaerobacter TaxID=1754 RepID=B0K8D5_THEP3|nr:MULTISPECIES: site-specific integrase [Thermoanaerobacter]ABY95867.1 phage integrase family protein [Thermoanaerobacter pseudethanolicus ATCC 33223]ADV80793.1 integrase family protein [Thermoanaerobacter brockii subsp. finnii Ako-1]HBW59832.1 site-specific integrase [Thermoanaerobacter sp.]